LSVLTGSFAHQRRRNELSVRVKGHENPLIPKLCGIVLPNEATRGLGRKRRRCVVSSLKGQKASVRME
jgi:hypothetical protein